MGNKKGIKTKVIIFLKVIVLVLSFISALCGGFIVGVCCRCISTAGPLNLDYSPIYSFFGLILLVLGLWGLITIIKKRRKTLLRGIVIYSILLLIFCFYVRYSSEVHIAKKQYFEVGILEPNSFSVLIALFSVVGLFAYPFYKYEKDKDEKCTTINE